jgi:hypothetical protein
VDLIIFRVYLERENNMPAIRKQAIHSGFIKKTTFHNVDHRDHESTIL